MHVLYAIAHRNTGSLAALLGEAVPPYTPPSYREERWAEAWWSGRSTSLGSKEDFTPVMANCLDAA